MKQGAIFDMDGLLFDTERLYQESWIEMVEKFGVSPEPAFPPAVCGTSGAHMLEVIHTYYPTVDAQAFAQGCMARVDMLLKTHVPEKPGMRELLDYFRCNGCRIAVASSSARHRIVDNLRHAGVETYFDAVVSGEDVVHGKPAPDIFLLAAERLGCAPEDCYVFEDGINGVRAGLAAGCTTVMVPDLTPPPAEFHDACAGIFESLHEVRKAVVQGRI